MYTTNDACPSTSSLEATVLQEDDSSFELTANCDGSITANILGLEGGIFSFDQDPEDGTIIDSETGTITEGLAGSVYNILYTTNGVCPTNSSFEVTVLQEDDSSFELTATCDGATAVILGLEGGVFSFDQEPDDGSVIDPDTGILTGGNSGTEYFISYTTNGECPSTTINSITPLDGEDSSFELTATCDGATAIVIGLEGGTFSFAESPSDGAVIDPETGTISGGTGGTSYMVNYTTNGTSSSNDDSVIIGDQIWIKQNSELTTYNDGTPIPVVENWENLNTGAMCYYDDDPSKGALYNWYAIMGIHDEDPSTPNKIFEPDGLRLPTYEDWEILKDFLISNGYNYDGSFSENKIGKSLASDSGWNISTEIGAIGNNQSLNNSSGFNAYPLGYRHSNHPSGNYFNFGNSTLLWSSTEIDEDLAYNVELTLNNSWFTIPSVNAKSEGFSVRFLKENETNLCPTTTTVEITTLEPDDSSFELTATCDGGIANITGLEGGLFEFVIEPTDGATIDLESGLITGGDYGSEYEISYTTNGTCPTTTIESLTVNSPPEIVDPTPLEVCDDNIADGIVEMDLSIKNTEITNGNPDYSVSYYISEDDALSNTNSLPNLYTNISNPQTVYVRVIDINTNCFTTTSLELSVISAPTAEPPPNLEYCDADADGFGVFDLTELDEFISNGQDGLAISYHETDADAQNNVNAIIGEYNNIVAYDTNHLYVRIEESKFRQCNCPSGTSHY